MVSNILVIGSRAVNFTDDAGEKVDGSTVHFAMVGLEPMKGSRGLSPLKGFLRGKDAAALTDVPGLYEASFAVSANAAGKSELKLHSVGKCISPVDLDIK